MTNPVFEINDWALCKSQTTSPRGLYAKHLNCAKNKTSAAIKDCELAWLEEESPKCYICGIKVPDEIQTLMYLHEWDK